MESADWLTILHPALAVVLIYPLIGMVVRLGVQTRQRRMGESNIARTSGSEHTDLGRWLSAGVVIVVLIALVAAIVTKNPLSAFSGGWARGLQLLMVLLGTSISLVALWQATSKSLRLLFSLLTWLGVISLGAQPEVWRVSDNPFDPMFWTSHYWAGVGVTGLMLFSLGARPEILRQLRWRRIHVAANLLAAVLFSIQGITGTRDLLQIPPGWQLATIYQCNFDTLKCPPLASQPPAP
ncbi:DUF4079 domain-containing protein [Cyanobium sp. HWJ4-Hawea]|uniref:DUF4079 domain-containing protein n=1 Tax=Cyanobium sp. HWJ4-Hawea TaxID=2823713 RepID=UPI0020CD7788|nr:DUF4079 domain-containing protein [Cyanobium sp. HWJ4-Hawea]MCP9809444.1 DUF4079 domain-containing protein [Cyanobium sp. HWJ4-Hawea]